MPEQSEGNLLLFLNSPGHLLVHCRHVRLSDFCESIWLSDVPLETLSRYLESRGKVRGGQA